MEKMLSPIIRRDRSENGKGMDTGFKEEFRDVKKVK